MHLSKSNVTFSIDNKLKDEFESSRGFYKKSTLVEFWISEFCKGNPDLIPFFKNKKSKGVRETTPTSKVGCKPSRHKSGVQS